MLTTSSNGRTINLSLQSGFNSSDQMRNTQENQRNRSLSNCIIFLGKDIILESLQGLSGHNLILSSKEKAVVDPVKVGF